MACKAVIPHQPEAVIVEHQQLEVWRALQYSALAVQLQPRPQFVGVQKPSCLREALGVLTQGAAY
ncbi:MAG: hypothetical protein ACI3YI_00495 [Bacteroidaceae bacterium]